MKVRPQEENKNMKKDMMNTFTYKEILQQPEMWLREYDALVAQKEEICAFIEHNVTPETEIVTDSETGISITDTTKATTANTTFASANCTGKLSVTGINTGKTPEEIKAASERDNWMTAEEAKEYGMIDNVLIKKK